jgi:histidyl-tRNA synthetase
VSELVRAPVATIDWLPPRVALRQLVIDSAVRVFERAGFGQVVTPTFEDTALFARTAGDASDIVTKEMYSFVDRGGRQLTLRPEGTAPVVRAYLEGGQAREPQPVKLWYVAPMFRYARAQRGRYREHWQFGVESLGSEDPAVDAEVIALQAAWYAELGLLDHLVLQLNSIGDNACRPA